MAYVTTLEEAKPLYTIRRFNEQIYKIVHFKRSCGFATLVFADSDNKDVAGSEKFDASLSRARRMVFEKALCNEWDYFFTGTLDGSKHDRFDLQDFHRQLTEFLNIADASIIQTCVSCLSLKNIMTVPGTFTVLSLAFLARSFAGLHGNFSLTMG